MAEPHEGPKEGIVDLRNRKVPSRAYKANSSMKGKYSIV